MHVNSIRIRGATHKETAQLLLSLYMINKDSYRIRGGSSGTNVMLLLLLVTSCLSAS